MGWWIDGLDQWVGLMCHVDGSDRWVGSMGRIDGFEQCVGSMGWIDVWHCMLPQDVLEEETNCRCCTALAVACSLLLLGCLVLLVAVAFGAECSLCLL